MKRAYQLAIFLGLALSAVAMPSAAETGQPSGGETTRYCVILQVKQPGGGKGYHILIRGSQGFYRLYQGGATHMACRATGRSTAASHKRQRWAVLRWALH